MDRSVITIIVIMAFAFIIGKYKIVPYLAAKKILKDAKKGGTDDSTPAPVPPSHMPYQLPYGGYPVATAQPQPQPEKPSRRDMYFDYRIIGADSTDTLALAPALDSSVEEMFASLRNRGICPDSFDIVNLGDGLLLAYVTYIL